jgi:hypothetical protein
VGVDDVVVKAAVHVAQCQQRVLEIDRPAVESRTWAQHATLRQRRARFLRTCDQPGVYSQTFGGIDVDLAIVQKQDFGRR